MKRLLALFLLVVSCGSHDRVSQKDLPTIDVSVAEVRHEMVPILEQVVGTVTAHQQASVAAKVSGRIITMLAVAGKTVKKGDLLVEIEVNETRAALDRAQAALTKAEQDLKRYQSLLESAAVTQAEFDQIAAQQSMASASVREVQSTLDYGSVRAPFDGVIIRRVYEEGDLATPGQPLFVIEDSAIPRLEINVAESLVSKLEIGTMLKIDFTEIETDVEGVVREITPSADPASRTFLVKLGLPENVSVRAGQFARAGVPRGERNALLVPTNAVFQGGQMDYVFLADDGAARLCIVRLGISSAARTEVLGGIGKEATVILNPPSELHDGQPITTRP